ncbi:MAG: hypothetical protein QOC80_667 [Frankiaceae bacterium]|nr:hypothetical protein [Frankiaceae bacterium]
MFIGAPPRPANQRGRTVPAMVGTASEQIFSGTAWPPGRMRIEVRQLIDDLRSWGPYRHEDTAERFRVRANRVLMHLRSQPDGRHRNLPPDFTFASGEFAPETPTVTDAGAARLEAFARDLAHLLPGGGVEPRTAFPLAALHPAIQSGCAEAWRAGALVAAAVAARDVVLRRLTLLGGATRAVDLRDGRVVVTETLMVGAVRVGPPDSPAQQAVQALAVGLVEAVRSLPTEPGVRFGPDRALEVLALASLLLHRLEFAEARPTPGLLPTARAR